ncbi:hypothetical protein HK103_007470 [Boothiomyces macroporosus]|uniref:Uncharacterized protein n=1 Tax=Boothiomyces macroporosus TaxID=261099 RepID=A0AAD5Y408_9FUNG|nr:hypothetical protein HK103_007470 [Boothiomyces macroporosus]
MAAIYKLRLQINEYATKPCDALYLGIQSVHSNYKSELFLVSQSVELQSLLIFFEKDIEIQVQLFAYHGLLGNSDCSISIAKASLEFKETVFLITDTDQVCGILTIERLCDYPTFHNRLFAYLINDQIIVCDKQEWGNCEISKVIQGLSESVKETSLNSLCAESMFHKSTIRQFKEKLESTKEIDCKLDFNVLSRYQTESDIIEFTLRCEYHPIETDSDISKEITKVFQAMSVHQFQHQISGYKKQIVKDLESFKSIAQSYLNYETSKTKTQLLMQKTRATIDILISIFKKLELPARVRFGLKSDEYTLLLKSIERLDFHCKSNLLYALEGNTLKNVRCIYQDVLGLISNIEIIVKDFIPRAINVNQELILITKLVSLLVQKSIHIFFFELRFKRTDISRQEHVTKILLKLQEIGYLVPVIIPSDLACRFANMMLPLMITFHSTLQNEIQYYTKSEKYFISLPNIMAQTTFEIPVQLLFLVNPINKFEEPNPETEILQRKSLQLINRYLYFTKIPKLSKYNTELILQKIKEIQEKFGILFGQIVFNSNLEFTEKEVYSISANLM